MSEGEKVSRASFCAAQIVAWGKRADHLRALLARLEDVCSEHHDRAVTVCPACVDSWCDTSGHLGTNESALIDRTSTDDDTIEAMQRAIALCDMEAEHWRARSRGAAFVRGES